MSADRVAVDVVATRQAILNTRRAARALEEVVDDLPRLLDPLRTAGVPGLSDVVEKLSRPVHLWKKTIELDVQAAMDTASKVENRLNRLVNVDATWASIFGCGGGAGNLIAVNSTSIGDFLSATSNRFSDIVGHLAKLVSTVNDLDYGGPRANSFRRESADAVQSLVVKVMGALRDQARLISKATRQVNIELRAPQKFVIVPYLSGELLVAATPQLEILSETSQRDDVAWVKSGQLEGFRRFLDNVLREVSMLLSDHQTALLNLDWSGRAKDSAVGFVQRSSSGILIALETTTTEIKEMISEQLEDVQIADGSSGRKVRVNKSSIRYFVRRVSSELEALAILISNLSPSVELARYQGPRADLFRQIYEEQFEDLSTEFFEIILEVSEQVNLVAAEVGVSLGLSRGRLKTDTASIQLIMRGDGRLVVSHHVLEIDTEEMESLKIRIERSRARISRRLRAMRLSLQNVDWSGAARDRAVERWTEIISKSEQRIETSTQRLCTFIEQQIKSTTNADKFEL
jgi:hypothetical protein